MIYNLSASDCADLIGLRSDVRFQRFMKLISTAVDAKVENIIAKPASGDVLNFHMGQINAAVDILNAVNEAPDRLESLNNKT